MPSKSASAERAETVAYLRQMLGEMRAIADGADCAMLCYLIEMAYIEAGDILLKERESDIADDRYRATRVPL